MIIVGDDMNTENLVKYYNKFNEDKRLTRRHGQVEFTTTMKYINKYLKEFNNPKILDIGAGTGRYTIPLFDTGYDVTAVELVKHNLMYIKKQRPMIKSYLGNAINLEKFKDNSFDIILLFGPMYHLVSNEEKILALKEAKRLLKVNGILLISYYMNEYCIIKHGFIDRNIKKAFQNKEIDNNYHIISSENDLYSMSRLSDINKFNKEVSLKRIKIIAQDGPSDYIRPFLNKLDDEEFKLFIDFHLKTCEKKELLGASSHLLDIVTKLN